MAVLISDLRQHLEGQLTAKKNALNETEETLRKYVGDRAVDGMGGRPGRGRNGPFTPGRELVRSKSMAERLGNKPNDQERNGMGENGHGDPEDVVNKSVMSRVVKEIKSREETLEEQKSDKKVVDRNRRMFGALVGTLQRFNKEEIKKKDVLEKKKVVEKKVEEKTEREKEEIKNKKRELFDEQKKKKKDIQVLQIQMKRVEEYEIWENSKKVEVNFIRTKTTKPEIYWLPKRHTTKTEALLAESRELVEMEISQRKEAFENELVSIEKKLTGDLDKNIVPKEENEKHDQELNDSLESKGDFEEGGFMEDRRVVEREDQDGENVDLRMTLKNDLMPERIIRRKEDLLSDVKEERRIIVKEEKDMESKEAQREHSRSRDTDKKRRRENESSRHSKEKNLESRVVTNTDARKTHDNKTKDEREEFKSSSQDRRVPQVENSKQESKRNNDSRKRHGNDSSSDSGDERSERRTQRKRQRSGKPTRKAKKRDESSSSSSEEERRPHKRHQTSSSSSESEDERDRRSGRNSRGPKQSDKRRASSSNDDTKRKKRKDSKHESSSDDSSDSE